MENKKSTILYVGGRGGKTSQQLQSMVQYIKDNNLTECTINIVEVPNDYKIVLDRIKFQLEMWKLSTQDIEKKHLKSYRQAFTIYEGIQDYIKELEDRYHLGGE